MKQFWLSVIIPSHNGERWLAAALQSLVNQKEPGIEVIVIDGGSDDASLQIVSSFSDKLNIRAERRFDLLSWMAKTNFGVEQVMSDRICIAVSGRPLATEQMRPAPEMATHSA